jgi:hypothetical protein
LKEVSISSYFENIFSEIQFLKNSKGEKRSKKEKKGEEISRRI